MMIKGYNKGSFQRFLERFEEPAWMREKRISAWKRYEGIPLPSKKEEGWRRTDLSGLKLDDIYHSTALTILKGDKEADGVIFTTIEDAIEKYPDLIRRYFLNGSMPYDTGKFGALHESFFRGGLFLYVPGRTEAALTFRYQFFMSGSMSGIMPHTLIIIEEDSRVTVSEEFNSTITNQSGCFSNGMTEIFVHAGSELNFISLEDWKGDVFHLNNYRALVDNGGKVKWAMNFLGGRIAKTNIETILAGEGAETEMMGIYSGNNKQHIDLNTLMHHTSGRTKGDLLFKGVLKDESRSVFTGLIKIDKGASGCNSYLANHNLLLSENARADSMPRLEIENNDVKASHGATIGHIDEDQMFYLMSRGIERKDAERIIVNAFFEPVIKRVPIEDIKERLRDSLIKQLFPVEREVIEHEE